MNVMSDFAIPYAEIVGDAAPEDLGALTEFLLEELPARWTEAYDEMSAHRTNVLRVPDRGFTFLFDLVSAADPQEGPASAHDRVVAAYGIAKAPEAKRDASRIRGFGTIGGLARGRMDKGHLIAHSMGGSLDINVFPQRPEVNRGRSAAGKRYRAMERYAAAHPGTFVFSRPIYGDETWVPHALEYGVLLPEARIWVERFPN